MTDKKLISSCINQFSHGSLSANALALFKKLGYQSTLTFNVPTSIDKVFQFDSEKALKDEWLDAPFLFQLTESNLSNIQSLFTQVDGTIIESYMFVAIELKKSDYSRTQLVTITRELNKKSPQPILILFKHGETLTLSVIHRRLHKRDESKDVLEKVTLLKDIRINDPHRAHIDILSDLAFDNLNLKAGASFVDLHNAWQTVLDTKTLNKQFYKELSQWYFWAMKEVYFPNAEQAEAVKGSIFEDENKVREHNAKSLIRLLTRLLFVWFIKEKKLIPEQLFDENWIKSQLKGFKPKPNEKLNAIFQANESHYYRAILQNLFFATLNQTHGERKFRNDGQNMNVTTLMRYQSYFNDSDEFIKLVEDSVPFMNGGLFDCLDKPTPNLKGKQGGNIIAYEDGFSDRADNALKVPDYIFFGTHKNIDLSEELGSKQKSVEIRGLIDILKSYKFTIAENTPIEEDIALDPELLGQVFENLLASYNPETKTTARKQTGSFYTPREIVDYMVDESLIAYFSSINSEFKVEDLRNLLSYNASGNHFNEHQTKQLINAIDNCKILDPACGSGAFPMGVLHKLVNCLHKLDDKNRLWKARQIEKINTIDDADFRDKTLQALENIFDNEVDYGRKLYLIENCIYGVDIQAIAIQISKLRFFISLIVDQTIRSTENFGILPLPNLETKFVAANTLIGIDKPKTGINANSTINLFDNPEIEGLEHELKSIRHRLFSAKTPLTKSNLREKDKALRKQISELLEQQGWDNKTAQQLAHWNPYDQNTHADFFDVEWMFGLHDGFDIVIGNPPYIDSETMVKIGLEKLRNHLASTLKFTKGNWDIYIAFFEVGFNFLKEAGIITFITPDKWLSKPFGYELRKNLLNNFFTITESGRDVFESANVDSVITFIQKKHIDYFDIYKLDGDQCIKIAAFAKKELVEPYAFDWFFSDKIEILSKLESSPNKLLEIGTCENACATSDAYKLKEFVFDHDEFDAKKHFKIVNTGTVGKFTAKWGISPMTYLKDKYLFPVVDRNDFLNNFRNSYAAKSIKPKIIIKGLTLLDGCIDETGEMIAGKTTLILTENKSELSNLKFLLAFLNSKLPIFYIKEKYRGSSYNGGINFNVDMINNLPIPKISADEQQPFIKLADYILFIKKQPFYISTDLNFAEERLMSNFFENLIDALVYELYFPEELHEAKKQFMSLVIKENLPDLDAIEGDKVGTLKQIVRRLTDKNHPLYNNLFFLDSVPVVRIIQGKA